MTNIMSILVAAAATILASGGACVWHDDGSEVSVALMHRATDATSPALAGEPRTFVTADGDVVAITRALVSIESVEVVPCSGATASRSVREMLGPAVARAQHAHGGSATGAPTLDDLARADLEPLALARIAPPLGSYCAVRVHLSPATTQTAGAATEPAMVGRTLHIEARVQRAGIGDPVAIALESSGDRTIDVALRDATGAPVPVELTGTEKPELVLAMVYDTWVDSAVLSATTSAVQGELALDRVAASLAHEPLAAPAHHH